jgi:hypothetical protein
MVHLARAALGGFIGFIAAGIAFSFWSEYFQTAPLGTYLGAALSVVLLCFSGFQARRGVVLFATERRDRARLFSLRSQLGLGTSAAELQ